MDSMNAKHKGSQMSFNYPIVAMAHYNQWQNNNLINAADQVSDEDRQRDLGAFFNSIEKTFNHILWGDKIWLSRFGDFSPPRTTSLEASLSEGGTWEEFKAERRALDQKMIEWTSKFDINTLPSEIKWFSKAINQEISRPTAILLPHLFNHQTHHRGQIHAMLTRLGQKPGATDLPFMPDVDTYL